MTSKKPKKSNLQKALEERHEALRKWKEKLERYYKKEVCWQYVVNTYDGKCW